MWWKKGYKFELLGREVKGKGKDYSMFVLVRDRIRVTGTRKGILYGTSGLVGGVPTW